MFLLDKNKLKQSIKFFLIVIVVAIVIAIACFTVLKYEVEGEKSIPFQLGKIIVISSATSEEVSNIENKSEPENSDNLSEDIIQGNNNLDENNITDKKDEISKNDEPINEETQGNNIENYIWQKKVIQTNDVYIYLDKNENYKQQEIIKNVKIENIKILQNVKVGKIQVYMPNSLDGQLYKYVNDFLVNSSLTYKGASADNKKALEIGNQGGCVYISFANVGLQEYKSNEDTELQQGATILNKMKINEDDLKFKVSFDLIIEVNSKSYKANLILDMPINGVVGAKETHTEITDFSNVIFKRF